MRAQRGREHSLITSADLGVQFVENAAYSLQVLLHFILTRVIEHALHHPGLCD